MPKKIEISHRTIIFTVFFLLSLWVLFLIRDIILEFFIALLVMAVFDPFVTKMTKYKVPRTASVLLAYLIMIGAVGFTIAAIIPPLVDQTTAFIYNLPGFLDKLGVSSIVSDQIIEQSVNQIGAIPAKLLNATVSIFSNFLGIVAILVFAFYLLSERSTLKKQLSIWVGEKKEAEFERKFLLVEEKLGAWARGQLALMFAIGLLNYIGLSLLGIPFALPLSILAGLLEIVPYIGPTIAAVPAILIGFGISPIIGTAVAALAFLIQQVENYVFVPKIMQKSTGINPIITLLILAIGARLAGFVGLLISVPVFITLQVFLSQYFAYREIDSTE